MGPPGAPADSWAVYNDSLYLNFNQEIRQEFFSDADEHIRQGNARWVSMWGALDAGPFNTNCLAETWDMQDCRSDPQIVPGINPSPAPAEGTSEGSA